MREILTAIVVYKGNIFIIYNHRNKYLLTYCDNNEFDETVLLTV